MRGPTTDQWRFTALSSGVHTALVEDSQVFFQIGGGAFDVRYLGLAKGPQKYTRTKIAPRWRLFDMMEVALCNTVIFFSKTERFLFNLTFGRQYEN